MKLKLSKLLSGALLGLVATVMTPASAGNSTIMDLLKIMHENGQITDEQYEILLNGAKADQEKANTATNETLAKVEKVTKNLPKITTKGKFKIESQDGQHSIQPIGRIFWDSITSDEDNVSGIGEGTELRRGRIGLQMQFFNNWKAKLEYDFAGEDASLKDSWIAYQNKFANGNKYTWKVGNHAVPFGFNTVSSSKYMSFLRRPIYADGPLSPSRQPGISFRIDNDNYFAHAGMFHDKTDEGKTHLGGDGARFYSLRVAGTPYKRDKKHLLHIGGSYMFIDNRDDSLKISQRALTHLDSSSSKLFDTGTMSSVDDINAFDLEALAIYGPFHALAEYTSWDLDTNGTTAETLSGWSIETGYFLTGESMKYKKGQFSGVSPKSPFMGGDGLGAWQMIARYENMDLNDRATEGGDGDVLSLGLNWTPVKNIRFMATWNKLVDFDRAGNAADNQEPAALSFRAMAYW